MLGTFKYRSRIFFGKNFLENLQKVFSKQPSGSFLKETILLVLPISPMLPMLQILPILPILPKLLTLPILSKLPKFTIVPLLSILLTLPLLGSFP